MTGTGGAGKSSLTDELVIRLLESDPKANVAILAIDPTRKKTGGALLGDRLRMNSFWKIHASTCNPWQPEKLILPLAAPLKRQFEFSSIWL